MPDNRINVILGAKDNATKVVKGLRGQLEGFKRDASDRLRAERVGFSVPSVSPRSAVGALGRCPGRRHRSTAADFEDAMTRSLAIVGDVKAIDARAMKPCGPAASTLVDDLQCQAGRRGILLRVASDGPRCQRESIEVARSVARFAQADSFDLATATDLLTRCAVSAGLTIRASDVIGNMRNMLRVSDVLVKANTTANATVEEFSKSLTNRGAAALRLVGKELEEGAAVLAALAPIQKRQGHRGRDTPRYRAPRPDRRRRWGTYPRSRGSASRSSDPTRNSETSPTSSRISRVRCQA